MCAASHNEFKVGSRLEAPPGAVWAGMATAAGVNYELMPIVRMTVPRGLGDFELENVVPGERVGRSWILLFGLIPIDYDDITLVEIEAERGFLERSRMLTQRLWEHERRLEADGGGCVVTDRIRFEPRLPIPPGLLRPVFRATFLHRHRRLRRRFGGQSLGRLSP